MKVIKYKCDATNTLSHRRGYFYHASREEPRLLLLNFKSHFQKAWHPPESAVSMKISNSRHELYVSDYLSFNKD